MQNVRDALARAATLVDRLQFAAAEEIARQVVRALPDCAAALVLLGIVARKTDRAQEAVEWLRRACSCRPDDAAIRCELGRALADCRRLDEAAQEFRRAIELNPEDAGACLNLGAVLGQLDQPEAAIEFCRRAVELAPNDAVAHFNRGNIARSLGMLDEATAAMEAAIRLAPDFAAAHWNCGYCYLLAGDFPRGWREHEWRERAGEVSLDVYPQPRWNGGSLEGRTILVHGEQGIGDEILFGSCLPELILRAGHCVIVCDPRLAPLLKRSFSRATVHGFTRRQDRQGMRLAEQIDVQIPIGSLPLYLRTSRESFPPRKNFLTADAAQVADWKQRFAQLSPGLTVGISWRAGGQPGERRMRTTSLELWRPLFSLPEVRFVNLQYGDCVEDLAGARRDFGVEIHDWTDADPLIDMDAFAAKVAALDLVVSVDNSTVHLSGALGVPTWVLLPHVPGWRWSLADSRSLWYPRLRFFRQPRRGDWGAVFEPVGRLLGEVVGLPDAGAGLELVMAGDGAAVATNPGKAGDDFGKKEDGGGHPWAWDDVEGGGAAGAAASAEIGWAPTMRAAVAFYEQGDFANAEVLCRRVLNHSPRHLQATNLLGALAGQTGRLDLAIRTLGRAAAMAGDDLVVSLNMAAAFTDAGQLDRAIDAYRQVIELHPDSSDAHLGYGKALQSAGLHGEAIAAVQHAVRLRPDQYKTFNLLGAWCLMADRLQEAEAAFREAVRLKPDYMAAYNNLGLVLERQDRFEDAKNNFSRAFELDRSCLQAANNLSAIKNKLGVAGSGSFFGPPRQVLPTTPTPKNVPDPWRRRQTLFNHERHEIRERRETNEEDMKQLDQIVQRAVDQLNAHDLPAAEATCREIFALDPKNVNALRILGAIARERNEFDRALEYCLEAVRQADRLAVLHFELGVTYFAMHRSREAFETYLKAIELDPTLYVAHLNVSAIMEQQERFAEARDWALKTLQIKPNYALAHYNLANAYRELGAIDEAIQSYELAHRYRPEHPKTLWNLGICHLLSGNYREGWPLFECRQEAEEVMIDRFPQPRWDGSSLDGRTIVVHAEQGIGDEILFASCFPDIIARAKGGRCVLVCDPRLERLFARSFPDAKVYPHARLADWSAPELPEKIDVQIPAGSLPLYFRGSREAFPRRKRFLVVEPKLEAMWRDRVAALGGEIKVGISWRAGGKPTERRKRSIPLEQWGELLATPGVRFVNLQYGDALADIAAARARFGVEIHDWEEGDPLVDVDSHVAKISALDLVISVGNATVHMAGAVGTPAWTLLPSLPSWRWMAAGDVSPWYSGVRLFRQQQRGGWEPVLQRIAGLLWQVAGSDAEQTAVGLVPGGRAKPQASFDTNSQDDDVEGREAATRWLGGAELVGHEILDTVNQLIADGLLAEQLGDFDKAESHYREVLQLSPRHVKALRGLGIVARKTHRNELAIRCFRRTVAVVEPMPDDHLHLADALLDAGRVDEAVSGYQRALDLNPSHAGARLQIGRVLRQNGRHQEAAEHLRAVLAIDPRNHDALLELGRSLAAGCRIDEAIDCFRQALQSEPGSTAALETMGSVYLEDHCYDDAEECFKKAVALDPGRAESHFHLARALDAQGRSDEAAVALEQAVALDPRADGPLLRLALVRRAQGELGAAAELLRRAAAAKPDDADLLNSLGVVLREQGQTSDALRVIDRALQLESDHADAHLNRGLTLLQAGRLAAGWTEYEWRGRHWQSSLASGTPRWNGDSLTGRTILVHAEQSLAEELLFASCYEEVIARAAECAIVCDPRMERLFKRSFPAARVFPVVRGGEAQWRMPAELRCDVQIPAGSLPRHFRGSASSFPRPHHFLTADAARVARWRERYATVGEGLKIGLAWHDGERQKNGRGRDIAEWRSLVQWSGSLGKNVRWINLQDGDAARAERATLESEMGITIHDWPDAQSQYDLDDVAARIVALDLVISVGGVPAHLGGALGVPGWVVVRPEDEWRWLSGVASDRDSTPWYSSVRLFRGGGPDSSKKPMESLRGELLKRLELPAEEQRMRSNLRPHWGIHAAERGAPFSE